MATITNAQAAILLTSLTPDGSGHLPINNQPGSLTDSLAEIIAIMELENEDN